MRFEEIAFEREESNCVGVSVRGGPLFRILSATRSLWGCERTNDYRRPKGTSEIRPKGRQRH